MLPPYSPLRAAIHIHRRLAAAVGRAKTSDADEAELAAARTWLARLDAETIPRSIGAVSFSRSSGPGGQNVNKVSSKATLRVPLAALLGRIPAVLHGAVRASRYVAPRSEELVIQADDSRKQQDNVDACFRKLQEVVWQAGQQTVPGETSAEQGKRVQMLQKAEAAGRRRMKEAQSKKKSARRSGGRGDD